MNKNNCFFRKHNPQKGKLNKARPPQYQLRQKRSIDSNKTEEKPELRQKNCEGTNKLYLFFELKLGFLNFFYFIVLLDYVNLCKTIKKKAQFRNHY